MNGSSATRLLYLVTEDWYFVSHRLALACAARDAGFEVIVVTRVDQAGDAITRAGLRLIPIEFSRSGLGPLHEAITIRRLVELYRDLRPTVVHHVAMKPVIYGSLAARITGVPGIVNAMMGLGFVFSSEALKARILRPTVRMALGSALRGKNTRVIVQNEDDFKGFHSEGLARKEDLRLIRGSGVDPDQYSVSEPPTGIPIVVLPARILKDKGVEEFVTAARQLKLAGVNARFVLVGDPDPLNPTSLSPETIATWVREGVIEHWGWKPAREIPAVLAQSSLVCLPSYREGLPKALLEAAAAGRAIVTTDVPGCREIVRQGVNGWRVPVRNAEALANALRMALSEPELCRKYGAKGREMVETEFSLASVIRDTLAVYREFTGNGNP